LPDNENFVRHHDSGSLSSSEYQVNGYNFYRILAADITKQKL